MKLSELKPTAGTNKRTKRRGRGPSSGHGKTSCRGHKGQRARASGRLRPGFEGGQMPLIRRIPKRGFTNRFKVTFQVVNLDKLEKFKEDSVITPKELQEKGFIEQLNQPIKILGKGKLTKKLTVKVQAFSQSALEEIKKLGGLAEIIK